MPRARKLRGDVAGAAARVVNLESVGSRVRNSRWYREAHGGGSWLRATRAQGGDAAERRTRAGAVAQAVSSGARDGGNASRGHDGSDAQRVEQCRRRAGGVAAEWRRRAGA
eukprot:3846090-Pleurochrysis_carterae.AAC.1